MHDVFIKQILTFNLTHVGKNYLAVYRCMGTFYSAKLVYVLHTAKFYIINNCFIRKPVSWFKNSYILEEVKNFRRYLLSSFSLTLVKIPCGFLL